MNASRLAYTVFVAFVSVILTLIVVNLVQSVGQEESADTGKTGETMFTMEQVANHDSADSCWKVIDGVVYDFTDYVPEHPSDPETFMRWCGKDATQAWRNKDSGRPHSPRAEAMLENYRIGVAVVPASAQPAGGPEVRQVPAPTAQAPSTKDAPPAIERQWGQMMLSLAPGQYLDGVYRGSFIDRGAIQVSLEFRVREGRLHDIQYRYLFYRDVDYLPLTEGDELFGVLQQYRQITQVLEGEPLTAIFRLYRPAEVVDDIDGYSGATLRGAKVMHAIRDGLNRGVYSW